MYTEHTGLRTKICLMELCHFFRQIFIFLITRNNVKVTSHPSNILKHHKKYTWVPGVMPYAMFYAHIWKVEVNDFMSIIYYQ